MNDLPDYEEEGVPAHETNQTLHLHHGPHVASVVSPAYQASHYHETTTYHLPYLSDFRVCRLHRPRVHRHRQML